MKVERRGKWYLKGKNYVLANVLQEHATEIQHMKCRFHAPFQSIGSNILEVSLLPRLFHPYIDCHVLNITIVLLNLDWGYVWDTLWFILLILQHHLKPSCYYTSSGLLTRTNDTYLENNYNKNIIACFLKCMWFQL